MTQKVKFYEQIRSCWSLLKTCTRGAQNSLTSTLAKARLLTLKGSFNEQVHFAMTDFSIHRIRLKGPWEVLAPDATDDVYLRQSMPQDWRSLFGRASGTAWFRRKFHRPTGLLASDRVVLHFPSGIGIVENLTVNDRPVSSHSNAPLKFDITAALIEFNQLEFSLCFDPDANPDVPGGLWETVYLEIHSEPVED